jgi:hypothetical protein
MPPSNWNVNITSDIIVEVGETEQFLLSIIPPDGHNETEIILIEFNSTCYGHPEAGYDVIWLTVTAYVP